MFCLITTHDSRLIDLSGCRYGLLVVIGRVENDGCGNRLWLCQCDCGSQKVIQGTALKRGSTSSCGCATAQKIGDKKRAHGKSHTSIYVAWCSMRSRCSDPKSESYSRYGGRGIRVCDRWNFSFESFISDMGDRPEGMTIELIDNDGNYEPGNCRWATVAEQGRNKSNNRMITAFGMTYCLSEWVEITGMARTTLKKRLNRGIQGEHLFMRDSRFYKGADRW